MATAGPTRYDAIVLGSGQGGTPLAAALAGAGRRTAIVERGHVGGTCVNVGCTPTKTMVASARVAYLGKRAAEYGVATGVVSVSLAAVKRRKDSVVGGFRSGSRRRLEAFPNLDLIHGTARFAGPHWIDVALGDGSIRSLVGEKIFINVGCRPGLPGLEGLSEVQALDSSSILELTELPEKLLILGGGYIGVEFGQMFRRFGSDVTVVHRGRQLLAQEDPDVSAALAAILREDGVQLHFESEPIRVRRRDDGRIELVARSKAGEAVHSGSHLLVATGRVPNTASLDLASAGVRTDIRGFVVVNDRLETTAPGVYCLGDANGGPAFTHVSYDDFRIVRDNLLEGRPASTKGRLLPYTVFTDPQLGRVGLNETQAAKEGKKFRVAVLPMTSVARAIEVGETRGFQKVLVEEETGRSLGCAVLGIEGGEMMSMIQIAMMGNLPYHALREAVFAHPTLAESFNNLFAKFVR